MLDYSEKLIPVVIQDVYSGDILMLAWSNRYFIMKSVLFGYVFFFSRSRNLSWLKGEYSTNFQLLKELYYDCDSDSLLLKVVQVNKTSCHTGMRSCFYIRKC
ncbi:phosphoribosyl-AMP cyclohydrolase [Candidatus Vidania fulgoroideae]|uniref:phosphoribosyl-AMP cyclohydrolase n=1 Tax=Candidatus Vidania fulgoroideorum TaxID=881286 RepID=A0A975AEL8_9PROT|nr:phosphoribosyl-AMP cyclohydrolase [Candidatus Vidania fulgoroideae]